MHTCTLAHIHICSFPRAQTALFLKRAQGLHPVKRRRESPQDPAQSESSWVIIRLRQILHLEAEGEVSWVELLIGIRGFDAVLPHLVFHWGWDAIGDFLPQVARSMKWTIQVI